MKPPKEQLISGPTLFYKFVFPAFFLGFGLIWTIGVAFVSGPKGSPPSPILGCFGLIVMAGGLYHFIPHHFPLKKV